KFRPLAAMGLAAGLGAAWIYFGACEPVRADERPHERAAERETLSTTRLLTVHEGWSILTAARAREWTARGAQDCSHVIHLIYRKAGFEYPYQNSYDLYDGAERFARVKFPHSGDLVVWPGHVGIVASPLRHSFYSLVRTGFEEQDYQSTYWRS